MPADAGIQILDSGFRRNDDASIGVLNPIGNKSGARVHSSSRNEGDETIDYG